MTHLQLLLNHDTKSSSITVKYLTREVQQELQRKRQRRCQQVRQRQQQLATSEIKKK